MQHHKLLLRLICIVVFSITVRVFSTPFHPNLFYVLSGPLRFLTFEQSIFNERESHVGSESYGLVILPIVKSRRRYVFLQWRMPWTFRHRVRVLREKTKGSLSHGEIRKTSAVDRCMIWQPGESNFRCCERNEQRREFSSRVSSASKFILTG